jgi:hypothetical protein
VASFVVLLDAACILNHRLLASDVATFRLSHWQAHECSTLPARWRVHRSSLLLRVLPIECCAAADLE